MQTNARWSTSLEQSGEAGLQRIVDAYLSSRHREHPGAGCAIAALGPDIARQSGPVKDAFSKELVRLIDTLTAFTPGGSADEKKEKAMTLLSKLVGAIVLSRVMGHGPKSDELLAAVRKSVASSGT
jgi:TetR/AcrR family transcriptional repressor of nem operon